MADPLTRLIEAAIARQLPRLLARLDRPALGQVTSTSPLQVRLDGDPHPTTVDLRDASYQPVTGHRVWLLWVAGDLLVGGRVREHDL